MESEKFTPEQSLSLITQTINEARTRFEENGFIYIFWGILVFLAAMGQFLLLKNEMYDINYYPYFIMPLGGVSTGIYHSKKKHLSKINIIGKIIAVLWIVLSLNMMIIAFFFYSIVTVNLTPFIIILTGIGILVSGISIKYNYMIIAGILANLSGFACFLTEELYHSLFLAIVSLICVLLPGVLLKINPKNV